MESIIETLYINLPGPQAPNDPETKKIQEEYFKMCDIIKAQYGLAFLDRFTALREQLNGRSDEDYFFLGFRACARLVRAVLG